jgi:hypothetical protein
MTPTTLVVESSGAKRRVNLDDYLTPAIEESAIASANEWIKALRNADVDGQPMRRRFTYRGDSLWWFTELYLHKTQTLERLFRAAMTLEELAARERPQALVLESGGRIVRGLAPQVAAARGIAFRGTGGFDDGRARLARLDLRARGLYAAALLSRLKWAPSRSGPRRPGAAPAIAAFVHRAFWKTDVADGSAEAYIGPVLAAIERDLPAGAIAYVGVGPTENFAARRWWRPAVSEGPASLVPVERFAPLSALAGSRRLWRDRYALRRALWQSADVRARAVIRGCDCWPVIREELAGVALLQWPWSARAMDEAAAALDALQPRAALTYAEAGGWGRAIVLEARRRGLPAVGLQHGFIYRHWLNYLHEPDEMQPEPANPADTGFPAPALTLLFDEYAADHLTRAGRFPPAALAVTGSAKLDALVAAAGRVSVDDVRAARAGVTGSPDGVFVLLVTKFKQAAAVLPALVEAARALDVHLAIKTHPAETPDVYGAAARAAHVRVIPVEPPLAPLLRAAAALVTVNSTVALDAAVLDVPALVVALPNNLSPFVEAGVMGGAASHGEIEATLRQILYDQRFRAQLAAARAAFLDRFGMHSDGRAAERAAAAVRRRLDDRT